MDRKPISERIRELHKACLRVVRCGREDRNASSCAGSDIPLGPRFSALGTLTVASLTSRAAAIFPPLGRKHPRHDHCRRNHEDQNTYKHRNGGGLTMRTMPENDSSFAPGTTSASRGTPLWIPRFYWRKAGSVAQTWLPGYPVTPRKGGEGNLFVLFFL